MNFLKLLFRALIPISSIGLAVTGIIQMRSGDLISGVICIFVALATFVFVMRRLEKKSMDEENLVPWQPASAPRIVWILVFALVIISVIYVADNVKSAGTDRVAALTWVGAMLLGLLLTWRQAIRSFFTNKSNFLKEKIRTHRKELVTISLILFVAFLLRTISLTSHPYPWSGDEASIGIAARQILNGEITNFFDTGWSMQSNWSFIPTAISEVVFGQNILAIRLPSVLAGTLAVLFVYLTARVLFNPIIGLIAAAFLATLPYHVHFSRIGFHNIVDSLISSILFWLLAKALKDDDPRFYYTAGVVGGLSIYTYAGTRLVLILSAATFLFVVLKQRGFLSVHWRDLFAFACGVILSIAPLAAYFVQHPAIFFGRLGQEGILFNGWLAQRALETGQSQWDILLDQSKRTILVFIASPAPGNFLNSPDPYLTIIGSTLFLFGIGYAFAHVFEQKYFILLVWFWAVILFGGILTLNPPANMRLLMTTPPLVIFMALGAYKIFDYLQKFRIVPEQAAIPTFLVLVLVISYQNIGFYMVEYQRNMYFENANGEFAMETGLMANDLREIYTLYFLGTPRVFSGFPTIPFLTPDYPRQDLTAEDIPGLNLAPDQKAAFFAIPENGALIEEISQKFPGGERGIIFRKSRPGEILFEYYILAP